MSTLFFRAFGCFRLLTGLAESLPLGLLTGFLRGSIRGTGEPFWPGEGDLAHYLNTRSDLHFALLNDTVQRWSAGRGETSAK